MLRGLVLSCMLVAGPVMAQDRAATLADIRQELTCSGSKSSACVRSCRRRAAPLGTPVGGTFLQARQDALELELRRLQTSLVEDLSLRSTRCGRWHQPDRRSGVPPVRTGGRLRSGRAWTDANIPGRRDQASDSASPRSRKPVAARSWPWPSNRISTARGRPMRQRGLCQAQATGFAAFTDTYPGGPLSAEAHFLRGEAAWRPLGELGPRGAGLSRQLSPEHPTRHAVPRRPATPVSASASWPSWARSTRPA